MRLFEMRRPPTQAGKAVLQFSADRPFPLLAHGTITLPKGRDNEFFPLRRRKQFLFVDNSNFPGRTYYWFGGTDEQPFLAQVSADAAQAFMNEGEEAFFASLKPRTIHQLEGAFNTPSRRQGDIFIMPLPFGWDQLDEARTACGFAYAVQPQPAVPAIVNALPVFGTSHLLTGRHLSIGTCQHAPYLSVGADLASGRLTAPNHRTRVLKGMNLLMQAVNIESD
ncbi:MAG TPA: hypothetical protein VJC16_07910 [Candidatus Nanoarchaeia archaeon]|nr:hypothetical protein [Candidatus Nanoarchaeia archaeon]